MKKAFSLVEMIVVIGIIAILMGVMLGTFSGSRDSALAAHCLSNMKNLVNAANSYAMAVEYFPPAVSFEDSRPDVSKGLVNAKLRYIEHPGWISWYSKGLYVNHISDTSQEGSCRTIGLYSEVDDDVRYAYQHGALYKHVSCNTETFICPLHKKKCPTANWSYFMNPNVSCAAYGKKITIGDRSVSADHVLMFGEIPFQGLGNWFPKGSGGNEETDPGIQYETENIGFNHKSGKYWVAHVAFCDGHVEKLRTSVSGKGYDGKGKGMTGQDCKLREATQWLCEGYDVTFSSGAFEKVAANADTSKTD